MPEENEIKLRVQDAESACRKITALGYTVHHDRVHEVNIVCDTADLKLRHKGSLLRVRSAGGKNTVTFKGPGRSGGSHKNREEIEFRASNDQAALALFEKLGFVPIFRYEKYRTEYAKSGAPGVITVDETPIGSFFELEGPPEWVDATARELEFSPTDYIKESYGALYAAHRRGNAGAGRDMVFSR